MPLSDEPPGRHRDAEPADPHDSMPAPRTRRRRLSAAPAEQPEPAWEAELLERLLRAARSAGPGVMTSLALHAVVLALLALLVISRVHPSYEPEIIGGFIVEPPGAPRKAALSPVEIDAVRIEPEPGETPRRRRRGGAPQQPADDPAATSVAPTEVSVGGALGGRGGGRGGRIESLGGSAASESAVGRGLAWLARIQKPDGRWELHRGYPDAGQIQTDTGATALALLCFLGTGQTHREGEHRDRIKAGLRWLTGVQKTGDYLRGDLYDHDREGDNASFYAHAQGTMALGEAYALTRDEELLPSLHRALDFLIAAQHPQTGGWKYRRHSEGDLSVFGWQIMALQTARMAGLEVSAPVLDRSLSFLDRVQSDGGAKYRYEEISAQPTFAMTAEGLLCRQYLGWPPTHPALRAGVAYMVTPENLPKWVSGRRNLYAWYYATQVLHNVGGAAWESWNAALRDALVEAQIASGRLAGSWHPFQPRGAADEHAEQGGRLYITCLSLLTLEVYYRHLPLYRDATAPGAAP